jgi:hypothetical protein
LPTGRNAIAHTNGKEERSLLFLKKRSKKLLLMASGCRTQIGEFAEAVNSRSFLVTFSKKEHFPCFASLARRAAMTKNKG